MYITKQQQEEEEKSRTRWFVLKVLFWMLLITTVSIIGGLIAYRKWRRKTGREIMKMELKRLDFSIESEPPEVI
jgi:hypothetical protein